MNSMNSMNNVNNSAEEAAYLRAKETLMGKKKQ